MSPELDKKLCEDFPEIFADRNGNMKTTAMCWGFDCDDGWFQLIYDLCAKLAKLDNVVRAVQVKEKYGSLRFYVNGGCEKADELIDEADTKSQTICEICGKPGDIRGTVWLKTLCDEHNQDYNG